MECCIHTDRSSKMARISLLHYIHYISIPLYTIRWSKPFLRGTDCMKSQRKIIQSSWLNRKYPLAHCVPGRRWWPSSPGRWTPCSRRWQHHRTWRTHLKDNDNDKDNNNFVMIRKCTCTNTVGASSQCYWVELMPLRCELMPLKCQISTNTNKNGLLLPTKCLEGVLKYKY